MSLDPPPPSTSIDVRHSDPRASLLGRRHALRTLSIGALLVLGASGGRTRADERSAAAEAAVFPRLMGMNIGAKNYDDADYQKALARLDVVVLGFYKGWAPAAYADDPALAMRKAVREIKARNPKILVGQYTVLNEARDDPKDVATTDLREKLSASGWWLLDAAGRKVQWTDRYATWEVNFTAWTQPDAEGRRWPQWLAERNDEAFFRAVPELDIVYLDNVMSRPRVRGDWRLDRTDDDPADARIGAAYRAGHAAYWRRMRELEPRVLLVGNADNDLADREWRGQLDGAFLEGLMGESWSIEGREGWARMMERYRAALRNTRAPRLVGFNVIGDARDYRFFRYAYSSCLLDDGYFSFTEHSRGYSSVPWFDEYDLKLGRPLDRPPDAPWSQGVWRRDFENGVVLVNPTATARRVTVEAGLRRLAGGQDRAINDGAPVTRLSLEAKDGIVLRR